MENLNLVDNHGYLIPENFKTERQVVDIINRVFAVSHAQGKFRISAGTSAGLTSDLKSIVYLNKSKDKKINKYEKSFELKPVPFDKKLDKWPHSKVGYFYDIAKILNFMATQGFCPESSNYISGDDLKKYKSYITEKFFDDEIAF